MQSLLRYASRCDTRVSAQPDSPKAEQPVAACRHALGQAGRLMPPALSAVGQSSFGALVLRQLCLPARRQGVSRGKQFLLVARM